MTTHDGKRPASRSERMTHPWAMAWMLVGLLAAAYPLWRPAPRPQPVIDSADWLRSAGEETQRARPAPSVVEPPPRRAPRGLPKRPAVPTAPLPLVGREGTPPQPSTGAPAATAPAD